MPAVRFRIAEVYWLNLRPEPNTDHQAITKLKRDTPVEKLDEADEGAWYRVRVTLNERTVEGWVSSKYLQPDDLKLESSADVRRIFEAIETVNPERSYYRSRDLNGDGESETFCNWFVADVLDVLGIQIPRYGPDAHYYPQPHPIYKNEQKTKPYSADHLNRFFNEGGGGQWREIDRDTAANLADQGKVVVASVPGSPGHIALVIPGSSGADVRIAQAGKINGKNLGLEAGFGNKTIEFFVYIGSGDLSQSLNSQNGVNLSSFGIDSNLKERPSHLTGDRIDAYLKTKPAKFRLGLGKHIIDASKKYGINATYILAHAIHETAWGTSKICREKHNLFGWSAFTNSPYESSRGFPNDAECIDFVMGRIDELYLRSTGKYFNTRPCLGNKNYGMNVRYADDPQWGEKIAKIARSIEGAIAGQRFSSVPENHEDWIVSNVYWLNLRPKPDTDNEAIAQLRRGTLVKKLGENADGSWYRVRVQVKNEWLEGWLSSKYLRPYQPDERSFADQIVEYMQRQNYTLDREPGYGNIVAIEGVDPDGSPNRDAANQFNDVLSILVFESGLPKLIYCDRATTEPGYYYTQYPVNPRGAARIEFGQYQAWKVGTHKAGTASEHEALVQRGGTITVRRDGNQDGIRTGDPSDTGYFGINIHGGWDASIYDIGLTSAGCIVTPKMSDHRKFMQLVKQDPRYRRNQNYVFRATIIPGDKLS
ncbi:MAG: SH3 domain-containing protein [Limnospira sp.]